MSKIEGTLTFDDEKLEALEFYLRKANATVQKRMDEALRRLYEETVPEEVREFVDRKSPPPPRPKRPAKPPAPKPAPPQNENKDEKEESDGQRRDQPVAG